MKKNNIFATLWRWVKRAFWGTGKELSEDDKFAVEKIESPSVMAVKAFFRRKLAVGALIVLISMFLFVFIGPKFFPMDLNYTDALQANMPPNNTLLKVPEELEDNIKNINGFSDFTVGVSEDNILYLWGNTKNTLTNIDFTQMPDELLNGTIDPSQVKQLIAGYQATALVMEDGKMYMWGNNNAMLSLPEFTKSDKYNQDVEKVALSNYYAIIMRKDGTVTGGQTLTFNMQKAVSNLDGDIKNLRTYMADRTVLDIAATNNCYAFIMDDGSIVVFGAAEYGEKDIPEITAKEKMVSINAGTRHFVAVGESGKVYTWGHNDGGQCDVAGETADKVYTGAKQTYLVNEDGELTDKSGFKGYPMGTDNRGRDILTRIVHGGKMTMTIGAVAVIVSTIIAIIVGCLAGYFGGWVDMLLMRITEIFSSLPFLPFAMMLSYVIRTMPIGETTRIFIIMVMLGLLSWTGLARMIRAQVLAEREKEFVLAAQSMGVKEKRIAFMHILPNVISVILVNVTLSFASCMLTESSLSYLGFGVQQPQPTWGNMLNGANNSIVIQNYWWQWVFPSIFLAIATISINIIGDTLRDVLDPKSSQEK